MWTRSRLSEKLIALTIGFVLLAEAVIFIPSLAAFRQDWLRERADQAGLLAQAIDGVPDFQGAEALSKTFMMNTGIEMVAAEREGRSEMLLGMPLDMPILRTLDLREMRRLPPMRDALRDLLMAEDGAIRVVASSPVPNQSTVEYLVPHFELRGALWEYGRNILVLSLLIAVITGALIYASLSGLIVRPVKRLAGALTAFRQHPTDPLPADAPNRRADEIGDLEREFARLSHEVQDAINQRERLATLGLAVAKINHDLRNILGTAQLVSDRIAIDPDPRVRRMGERLERVVSRGIRVCQNTLDYTRAGEEELHPRALDLRTLLDEVAADTLAGEDVAFHNHIPQGTRAQADADAAYRIFQNIVRNAAQALRKVEGKVEGGREIHARAAADGSALEVTIRDTGPGLPERAREALFLPFAASGGGAGSTGLGLSISRELAHAMGGGLRLESTGPEGTVFVVGLPVAQAPVAATRETPAPEAVEGA